MRPLTFSAICASQQNQWDGSMCQLMKKAKSIKRGNLFWKELISKSNHGLMIDDQIVIMNDFDVLMIDLIQKLYLRQSFMQ